MTPPTSLSRSMSPVPVKPARLPPHRWKVLAAGVFANAAFSVAFSGIPMTAVWMRSGYELDNVTLGLVLGLMSLGICLSELPWGLLTDRWGDRPVLLTGLVGTSLALACMAAWAAPSAQHIPGVGGLAGGLVLVGLLGGSVNGASGRAVMTWFAEGERGLAMSIRQTAVPLGGAVGAWLLPALALHSGFAAVYGVLAGICLLAAWMAGAWVHEPSPEARSRDDAPEQAVARRPGPLSDPGVWRICAGIGILCAPQFAVLSFGTVFLHDFAHAGLTVITASMVLVQVGAMVLRVWSGRWTDRRRNRPAYLRVCSGLSVLLFAALAAACVRGVDGIEVPVRAILPGLLVACGICVSAWHGVAFTELAVMAGAARAGTALGLANTSVFAVCFVVPSVIPRLLERQGWVLVWAAAAACALIASGLLWKPRTASPRC